MAKIKDQKPRIERPLEDYPEDERAQIKAIRDAKNRLKDIKENKAKVRKAQRLAEVSSSWVLLRYVQAELRKRNKGVSDLVTAAANSCQPHEGYDAEKANADKGALLAFLKANAKA